MLFCPEDKYEIKNVVMVIRVFTCLPLTPGLDDVAILRVTYAGTEADQRYEDENIFYGWGLFAILV